MNIINLNQIAKIVYVKLSRADDDLKVIERATPLQWFLNLFRKNKIKNKWVRKCRWPRTDEPIDKFLETFEKEYGDRYKYSSTSNIFYEKPHIVLWYSDYNHGNEIRYFETDKEANDYFLKLRAYIKQLEVPFINFYTDNVKKID